MTRGPDGDLLPSLDEEDIDLGEIGLLASFVRSSNAVIEFRKGLIEVMAENSRGDHHEDDGRSTRAREAFF